MSDPRIIPVGQELPPMYSPDELAEREARRTQATGKVKVAKGSAAHRQSRDRFGMLNAFADYGARLVDTTAQACWWILYRETKPDGLARVSHGRIAECIGRSRLTVVRAVRKLEKLKLITVVRRGGLRDGVSTYRVYGSPLRITGDTR